MFQDQPAFFGYHHIFHKFPVQFNHIERSFQQDIQGGITAAEIIHQQSEAFLFQLQSFQADLLVVCGFRNFQFQQIP